MDEATFWKIIDAGAKARKKRGVIEEDEFCEAVTEALGKLTPEQIIGFRAQLDTLLAKAYSWDLWGAAYIIAGGCSDDGFEYFRLWLIAQGQAAFNGAIKDADSALAAMKLSSEEIYELEGLLYIADEAYEELLADEEDAEPMTLIDVKQPSKPSGKPFDEDDEEALAARWPKLFAQFAEEA
jgi:hypothetical protein